MTNLNDVLLAMSNIPVVDPIAEIWGRGLQGRYTVIEYTGALPLTINANGNALLDYRIYGNTVQNDTPTPENPIMPIGCGEKTGNLFDKNRTVGIIPNAYINRSGRQLSSPNYYLSYPIPVEPNQDYTWSFNTEYNAFHTEPTVAFYDTNDTLLSVATHNNSIYWFNFTTPNDCAYIRASVYTAQGNGTNQLLLGSKSGTGKEFLPYIPYGYKLPILSNSTVTNIYLGEVETTRRIKKLVLTGDEYWLKSNTYQGSFYAQIVVGVLSENYTAYCSHLAFSTLSQYAKGKFCLNGGVIKNCNLWITEFDSDTTVNDFKTYLATQYANGTPVTVWYVLAEPETGIVNEPLMKIGNYSDTIDSAQANVQIPTYKGTNIIDYDGALKPSQMYIKYLGVKK